MMWNDPKIFKPKEEEIVVIHWENMSSTPEAIFHEGDFYLMADRQCKAVNVDGWRPKPKAVE